MLKSSKRRESTFLELHNGTLEINIVRDLIRDLKDWETVSSGVRFPTEARGHSRLWFLWFT